MKLTNQQIDALAETIIKNQITTIVKKDITEFPASIQKRTKEIQATFTKMRKLASDYNALRNSLPDRQWDFSPNYNRGEMINSINNSDIAIAYRLEEKKLPVSYDRNRGYNNERFNDIRREILVASIDSASMEELKAKIKDIEI